MLDTYELNKIEICLGNELRSLVNNSVRAVILLCLPPFFIFSQSPSSLSLRSLHFLLRGSCQLADLIVCCSVLTISNFREKQSQRFNKGKTGEVIFQEAA